MSGFWSSETLRSRLSELIEPYDPSKVKNGSYELHLGDQAYVTNTSEGRRDTLRDTAALGENEQVVIPPGQFALLLTDEVVRIPNDALGFISIRSRFKLWGLINVSGFHVDPGYEGKLIFSVYNAGSQPMHLSRGAGIFSIWYSYLDSPTEDTYTGHQQGKARITAEEIMGVRGLPYNPSELAHIVRDLQQDVRTIQGRQEDRRERRRTLLWSIFSGLIGGVLVLLISLGVEKLFP